MVQPWLNQFELNQARLDRSNPVEASLPLLTAVADPIRWQLIAQLSDRGSAASVS